jgi:predicted O-linked N-acetylglucosamine transferase (SPINDLY family)
MRNRISKSFTKFIDVSNMSDHEVALLSRSMEIDIAVDLKGYTKDNRAGIFALRCAPIQVSYLGYPGSTGANYIDYIIADETVIPEKMQIYYTEKIIYLPHCYQVNDSKRTISSRLYSKKDFGLPDNEFIFCCFNNSFKILPATFNIWMNILKTVEKSVLWLIDDNPTSTNNLKKEALYRGISDSRLIFSKRINLDDHLARHKLADLFLDTLPYNAHTTSSDALWAGLPVLTCMGNSFASRVAGSLLNALELPELITNTFHEYEQTAIELASNSEKLKSIKVRLNTNRLTTPLFDTTLFVKYFESAFLEIYQIQLESSIPKNIYL